MTTPDFYDATTLPPVKKRILDEIVASRMPLAELKNTHEFQRLTEKQKLFVSSYCEGGLVDGNYDSVSAIMTAYKCKSREIARVMSYSMMGNIRIIAVLNRHFNTTPIEDFLVMVDRAINNKKLSIAQMQCLRLKCEILGYANRLPTLGAPTGVIPQDVLDREQALRPRKPYSTRKPKKKSEFDQEAERI